MKNLSINLFYNKKYYNLDNSYQDTKQFIKRKNIYNLI